MVAMTPGGANISLGDIIVGSWVALGCVLGGPMVAMMSAGPLGPIWTMPPTSPGTEDRPILLRAITRRPLLGSVVQYSPGRKSYIRFAPTCR